MKHKVLITGAFGQVGADLVPELEADFNVLATDLQINNNLGYQCETLALDITIEMDIRRKIESWYPDIIINLASLTNVDGCERERELAWQINAGGVRNLIDAVTGMNVYFIQISTDYIFDGMAGPYVETDTPNPINHYGQTKLEGEQFLLNSSLDWAIIRTNVVFGAAAHTGASFLKWVVDSLHAEKRINIVSDQWNNPTWTVGIAETIRNFIDGRITGIYNYGGADYLNRLEFAQMIASIYDLNQELLSPIDTASLNQIAPRPLCGGLVNDRIETLSGIKCYTVRTAVERIRAQGTI